MPSPFKQILQHRSSTRSFTNETVDKPTLEKIFRLARSAPSGANLQPGKFHILTGDALTQLTQSLNKALEEGVPPSSEYSYFPDKMSDVLKEKQRSAGYALYSALGITRRDIAKRKMQFAKNYAFFDAPVGVVVTIDRDMGKGCFMDLGMAIMALLLSVEDEGLGATAIGALANYGPIVHETLSLPDNELVVCGVAIGFKETSAPVNQFRTDRAGLDEFTTFSGF